MLTVYSSFLKIFTNVINLCLNSEIVSKSLFSVFILLDQIKASLHSFI